MRTDTHRFKCAACGRARTARVNRNVDSPKPQRAVPPGWTEDPDGRRVCPECSTEPTTMEEKTDA